MATAAPRPGFVRRIVAPSWVRPEALNVTPELIGVPLAPHARRVWAMLADLVVIGLLSSTGSFWLAAGIAALVFQLRRRQRERSALRNFWLWLAIALLVFVAAQRATSFVERQLDPPTAAAAKAAVAGDDDSDSDDDDAAAPARHAAAANVAALLGPAQMAASGIAPPPDQAAVDAAAAAALRERQLSARVAELEGELAEARKPRPARWRDDVVKAAHRIGLGFGWAIAYFTLLPFWWKGQTVGKKLFGLRVVHLTGAPLTVLTCFGRYGGYAAGMATGASGFLQVLWDSNRQAIQDKIAHTVVVDLREARAVEVLDAAPMLPGQDTVVIQQALDAPREGAA